MPRSPVFGLALLCAAAPAFSTTPAPASVRPPTPTTASSPRELNKRSLRLLARIRAAESAPDKNTALLRSYLSALQAENRDAADSKVADRLNLAEANISLLEAGQPLPPPTGDETEAAALPDDAPAPAPAPAKPPSRMPDPGMGQSLPASIGGPESGRRFFDGEFGRGGAVAVGAPTVPASADLGPYLTLDDDGRKAFLLDVSSAVVTKLGLPDEKGERTWFMAWRLDSYLSSHPDRRDFVAVSLLAESDENLHFIYTLRDGSRIDQILGRTDEWTTPRYAQLPAKKRAGGAKPGGGKRKKKPAKPKKGDGGGGDDGGGGGGGGGGHRKGGRRGGGHGGGGGGGGGDDDEGGGGGDGEGGGKHPHVKVPEGLGKGGFDGGDSDSDGDVGGPMSDGPGAGEGGGGGGGGGRRRGGRRHGGGGGGGGDGERGGGYAGGGGGGSSGGRVRAGRSISGDDGASASGGSAGEPGGRRGTTVPLPKDFVTRGGPSGMGSGGGGGGGAGGGRSSGLPGFGDHPRLPVHAFTAKGGDVPAPAPAASVPAAESPMIAQTKAPASEPASAAPAAAAPHAPATRDEELRDAVAAHSAVSRPAAPVPLKSPSETPAAPAEPPQSPWPLAAGGAGLVLVAVSAFLQRRGADKS